MEDYKSRIERVRQEDLEGKKFFTVCLDPPDEVRNEPDNVSLVNAVSWALLHHGLSMGADGIASWPSPLEFARLVQQEQEEKKRMTQKIWEQEAEILRLSYENDLKEERLVGMEKKLIKIVDQVELLHLGLGQVARLRPKKVPLKTKMAAAAIVDRFNNGQCTCCWKITIVMDGKPTEEFTMDHWNNPNDVRRESLWPVCRACNNRLYLEPKFKADHRSDFEVYQKRRELFEGEQLSLLK